MFHVFDKAIIVASGRIESVNHISLLEDNQTAFWLQQTYFSIVIKKVKSVQNLNLDVV